MNNSSRHNRLPQQQYIYISCMQPKLVFGLPHLTFCTACADWFCTSLMFHNESCHARRNRKSNIEQCTNRAFEVKEFNLLWQSELGGVFFAKLFESGFLVPTPRKPVTKQVSWYLAQSGKRLRGQPEIWRMHKHVQNNYRTSLWRHIQHLPSRGRT